MTYRNAFVIMTALPPTKGHAALIDYAKQLVPATARIRVLVCTQPGEPWADERYLALARHYQHDPKVLIINFNQQIQQEPEGPEDFQFWDMWADILHSYGFYEGDYIVASESYANKLAEAVDGVYMPYDPYREIVEAKATNVRNNPLAWFDTVLEEFQPNLTKRVTIFGAESTGKTTLSKALAFWNEGHFIFEWARPYLETVKNEITEESMTAIWKGQRALQDYAGTLRNKPYIVQDTDLFSTWGYWNFWHPETLPISLEFDAKARKSDLYIITRSNIPFESDPLRYGGDKRESDDQYWIDIAERFGLNYIVLDTDDQIERQIQAEEAMEALFKAGLNLDYKRTGAEYK